MSAHWASEPVWLSAMPGDRNMRHGYDLLTGDKPLRPSV